MPYIRMKRIYLQGLLWLYLLLDFGYTALSLEPGFLDFDNLPDTNFSCLGKVIGGYYADLETNCQMFHVCTYGQLDELMDIRFLCLNGTVFDQETRVCERIDEVDCSKSEQFYGLNLELYGNTQPPISEDSSGTEQSLIIKSTSTTTTTTTSKPKATNTPYYSTSKPPKVTTQTVSHRFPLNNSPDIRFNPKDINISLHPGAPPDIRTKPTTYHQQGYNDNNKKVVVTTHSENSDNKKVTVTTHSQLFDDKVLPQTQLPRTQKPLLHNFGHASKNFQHPTPSDINYEFTLHQSRPGQQDFRTELPDSFFHSDFQSEEDYTDHEHSPQSQQFKSSTFHNDYTPTTKGASHFQQKVPTTVRNYFLQSLKPPEPNQPHHYKQHQTEKPQRLQLPLPLLPTLPPLTFSSPAPFSLQHHIETKRYTKDHPRIVISASASVSDADGRRLNYSLGTIGAADLLDPPPHSYDEYKEHDVGLDPFYHDVPKLKLSRNKRDTIKHSDIIRSEEEAVNVLKFLFDWYKNNEKTATEITTMPTIISTSKEVTTGAVEVELTAEASEAGISTESQEDFTNSDLFNRSSKFNIIGPGGKEKNMQDKRNAETTTESTTSKSTTTTKVSQYEKEFLDELFGHEEDYVNDNFEPVAYKQKYEDEEKKSEATTKSLEEVKNRPIPKDYIDDNIEPIYYKDRGEGIKNTQAVTEEVRVTLDERAKEIIKDVFPTQSISNVEKTADGMEKSSADVGDTETNVIKQNTLKEEETTTDPSNKTVGFSEPKSEILEPVTTEKVVSIMKPRNNSRRGRKRYFTTTEREKEPENKNVVLEKITERAHTAKDDFNYLRTLYKVYTTTPTYATEPKIEEAEATKRRRDDSDDFDYKEASPSDKILQTSVEENKETDSTARPPDLIPIVTTEATTTITAHQVANVTTDDVLPNTTTAKITSSTSPTIPTNITTSEKIIPSSTVSETITIPSTTIEKIEPNTTTSTTIVPSTTETVVSSRKDSRRRGRNRSSNDSSGGRNHRRRRPEHVHEGTDSLLVSSTSERSTTQEKTGYSDIVVEENGSNINRNIIPYPKITTEFIPTVSNGIHLGGSTDQTEFLTQLTLNYKKIFEDISQDAATLVVTEPYRNISPSTAKALVEYEQNKNEELNVGSYFEGLLLPPTTTPKSVEGNVETTFKSEVLTFPNQLRSEDQGLQTEESTTVRVNETTSTETGISETIPATLSTEDPVKVASVQDTTTNIPESVSKNVSDTSAMGTTTEEMVTYESKPVETTTSTEFNLNETTQFQEKNLGTTGKEFEEVKDTVPESSQITLLQEETQQTTSTPVNFFTTSIPKLTELFSFFGITKEKDILYESPTTLSTTEYSVESTSTGIKLIDETKDGNVVESDQSNNTRKLNEKIAEIPTSASKEEKSSTENYSDTIYILRTTESSTKQLQTTEPTVGQTETYPGTVLLIRTTELPASTESEEKISSFNQLSMVGLQRFIEGIEENTKSVVADTVIPTTVTNSKAVVTIGEKSGNIDERVIPTTERREDLEELTSLFQYTTESNGPSNNILATLKTEMTESNGVLSSTEAIAETTLPSVVASDPDLMSTSQIERLTVTERPTQSSSTTKVRRRGGRPTRRRNQETVRNTSRHRFSTDSFTRRPDSRRRTIENDILNELSKGATTESYRRRLRVRPSRDEIRDSSTDAPLHKSASPTRPERARESLPTTPLSKEGRRFFIFNCFGKEVDKFYPDPRDCRLFHYCTQGYNRNQLIDMKFVCDFNTYFDDEKLICSKRKPRRCV